MSQPCKQERCKNTVEQEWKARGGEKKQEDSVNLTFKALDILNGSEWDAVCSTNAP